VLALMKSKFSYFYGDIRSRDIDWMAWRELYDDEFAPTDAIMEDIDAGR